MLSQAFSTGEDIRLDFSTAESLDIAAIQLLWAAARQAEKTGRVFHAAGPLPEGIQSDVRNAGFDDFPVSLETQLLLTAEDKPDRAE